MAGSRRRRAAASVTVSYGNGCVAVDRSSWWVWAGGRDLKAED